MSGKAKVPLVVLDDGEGGLFLGGPPNEFHGEVMLDDHEVWDAYVKACNAMHKAQATVRMLLRRPYPNEIKS